MGANLRSSSKIHVFFDGECNLCNNSVRFIKSKDRNGIFDFYSLQSVAASNFFKRFRRNQPIISQAESIIIFYKNEFYEKSDAVLIIAKQFGTLWLPLQMFWLVPKKIRDRIYMFISKNRYKWFGRNEQFHILSNP